MKLEEIYKFKIAALLHDPPHKPFLLSLRQDHEEEARKLTVQLFGEEVGRLLYNERAKLADRTASSFDRWILSILMGEKHVPGLFRCDVIKIKNIVAPVLNKNLSIHNLVEGQDTYKAYINDLKTVLDVLDNWKLKYHALYLLYEPLWIIKGLPVGPADTRVPTHTVFDHSYAVAAMINWMLQDTKQVKGLLVGLDVAGLQNYIAASRKVRDAWVSSYIVSALTWYTIIELVEKLGPDVVVMPSLRTNIFYLYWLRNKLPKTQHADIHKLMEDLEKLFYISSRVLDMFKELGIPPYPIIPGRATLVLPPKEVMEKLLGKDLKEYFTERFRKGWKLLWEATRELARRLEQEEDLVWSFIKKVFDYYEKRFANTGFNGYPPLTLRIECVEVDAKANSEDLWRLYDRKYLELTSRLSLMKYRREEPETKLELYSLTKQAFDGEPLGYPKPSGRGFDYCTSCGKLPAIVILPMEEDEYNFLIYCTVAKGEEPGSCIEHLKRFKERGSEAFEDFKKWFNEHRVELERLKPIFSPGERLCPWCFLKRVVSLEPRLLKILLLNINHNEVEKLISELIKDDRKGKTWFPSTAHIASTRLYDKIASLGDDDFRKLIVEDVPKLMSSIPREKLVELCKPLWEKRPSWVWRFAKELYDKLCRKVDKLHISKEDKEIAKISLSFLVQMDPEDLWFNPKRRFAWNEIFRRFKLSKRVWRYYTLIRADGDSIGELLEGKLTVFLAGRVDRYVYDKIVVGQDVEEKDRKELAELLHRYIVYSCEGDFRKFVEFCMKATDEELRPEEFEKGKEKWAKEISKLARDLHEAYRRIDKVINILRDVINEARIIVSPSYHVAISAALMRVALLDVAVISGFDGITIYSGGDDLSAFVPIDKALDIIFNTRRAFAGAPIHVGIEGENAQLTLEEGFLKINNSFIPLLPSVGRSYCIYMAHYHYPLSTVLMRSSRLLDNSKNISYFEYFNSNKKVFSKAQKDVLVVAYNPRAVREEHALVPLTLMRPIELKDQVMNIASSLTFIKELLKLIDERFSGEGQTRLSHSLLYDIRNEHLVRVLLELINEVRNDYSKGDKVSELARQLIIEAIKRNARLRKGGKELGESLVKLFENTIPILTVVRRKGEEGYEREMYPVIAGSVDVARLIRSGAR